MNEKKREIKFRKYIRNTIYEAVQQPTMICHILAHINTDLDSALFKYKTSNCNNILLNSDSLISSFCYGRWWWVSNVYLLCKDQFNGKYLYKHLKRFNLSINRFYNINIKSRELHMDDFIDYLERSGHFSLLITNKNKTVFVLGIHSTTILDTAKRKCPELGNTNYITIAGTPIIDIYEKSPQTKSGYKEICIDQSKVMAFIKNVIEEFPQQYYIIDDCIRIYYYIDIDKIKTNSKKMYSSWQIKPAIKADVIYDVNKDKFRVVVLPLIMPSDYSHLRLFAHFDGDMVPVPFELGSIYFEPFELIIDRDVFNSKSPSTKEKQTFEENLANFEKACNELKQLLQTSLISITNNTNENTVK